MSLISGDESDHTFWALEYLSLAQCILIHLFAIYVWLGLLKITQSFSLLFLVKLRGIIF